MGCCRACGTVQRCFFLLKGAEGLGEPFFTLCTLLFLPATPPPACCEAAGGRGLLCSAPTSCLRRQLGLAGAVPDTHPPCWEGINRSGCRQGSRERAGLGLCPTTAPSGRGEGSIEAGAWNRGDWLGGEDPCRQQGPCGKLGMTLA